MGDNLLAAKEEESAKQVAVKKKTPTQTPGTNQETVDVSTQNLNKTSNFSHEII